MNDPRDYYAKCTCGDCRGMCDVAFGPSSVPLGPEPICEDCTRPMGECHICGEDRHLQNLGPSEVSADDFMICIYCQYEIERAGRMRAKARA